MNLDVSFSAKRNKNGDTFTFKCNKYTAELLHRALVQRIARCEELSCKNQIAKYEAIDKPIYALLVETDK